jgi:hypothetical protein
MKAYKASTNKISTLSWLQHYIKVSDKYYALAVLPLGKGTPIPIR